MELTQIEHVINATFNIFSGYWVYPGNQVHWWWKPLCIYITFLSTHSKAQTLYVTKIKPYDVNT